MARACRIPLRSDGWIPVPQASSIAGEGGAWRHIHRADHPHRGAGDPGLDCRAPDGPRGPGISPARGGLATGRRSPTGAAAGVDVPATPPDLRLELHHSRQGGGVQFRTGHRLAGEPQLDQRDRGRHPASPRCHDQCQCDGNLLAQWDGEREHLHTHQPHGTIPGDGGLHRPGHGVQGVLSSVRARWRYRQQGLTLIEVLFAISVMAVALLGVASMFPAALRSVITGGQTSKATMLVREMVEMIQADPFDSLVTYYNGFNTQPLTTQLMNNPPTFTCPVTPGVQDYNKKKWTCDMLIAGTEGSGQGLPGGYGTIRVDCVKPDGTINACSTDTEFQLRQVTVTVTWNGQGGARSV